MLQQTPILKYHNIIREGILAGVSKSESLKEFDLFIAKLCKEYRISSVSQALEAAQAGESKVIGLTFDDGYANYLSDIVPILQRHNANATFYVCSGLSEQQNFMWNDQVLRCIFRNKKIDYLNLCRALEQIGLAIPAADLNDSSALIRVERAIKYHSLDHRVELLKHLTTAFGYSEDPEALALLEETRLLTRQQIVDLSHSEMEVGGHTLHHPILSMETLHEASRQITDDCHTLSNILGYQPVAFAYPNGLINKDFTKEHTTLVEQAGYKHAVSATYGISQVNSGETFSLRRIELPPSANLWEYFKFKLKIRLGL